MKLNDFLLEVDDEDKGKAPPVTGGRFISTKQAAGILGRTVSRIRQLIRDKILKPIVKPRVGDRDHEISLKDVQALKNNMPKKGRPEGSKEKKDDAKSNVIDLKSKAKSKAKAKKAPAADKEPQRLAAGEGEDG